MQNDNILEIKGVSIEARSRNTAGLKNIDLCLAPGEIALVMPEVEYEHIPLCDLAEGLMEPDEGSVNFMGEDWQGMLPLRLCEMRGKIGRVFDFSGWVSNLTIAENLLLAERHHTSRTDEEIQAEMEQLCRFVGLPAVPEERPDAAAVGTLCRCQWVRAFMGNHKLFLLECPEVAAPRETLCSLEQLVTNALSAHHAVLWTTLDLQVWNNMAFKNARRYKICGGILQQVGEIQ